MPKICTYSTNGLQAAGVWEGDRMIDFNQAMAALGQTFRADSVKRILESGNEGKRMLALIANAPELKESCAYDVKDVRLEAPIPSPNKFMCLAGNYSEHLAENYGKENVKIPEDIHIFTKCNTSVAGPYDDIFVPNTVEKLDYELELGIVIGKKGRYIPQNKAADHIGGYVVADDISNRAFMPTVPGGRIHWFAMKSNDCFAPFGPCMLTADEIESISELKMRLYINGELRQSVDPAYMIFKPEWIVSRLSDWVTLEPGDVIITGTPAGNAWSRQLFLKDGDVIRAEMDKVGYIENRIVFEEACYRC